MKKSILSIVAAAAITGTAGANVHADEVIVKKGDTLWGYSQQYNVTVDHIKEWNGLTSNLIHPNDKLDVYPAKKYIVVKGDTLWDISREHNVTVEAIKEWNSLNSDLIFPVETLTLYPNAKVNKTKSNKKAEAKPVVNIPKQDETKQPVNETKSAESKSVTVEAPEKETKPVESKPETVEAPKKETKPAEETPKVTEEKPAAPENTSENSEPVKELTMEATAYTASCEGCSGITATGINLKENPNKKVISVDPNVIPLGSKVYVEGYGEAVAGDTGGAIKGNKIDIFIPSKEDAIEYGRKTVKVQILD